VSKANYFIVLLFKKSPNLEYTNLHSLKAFSWHKMLHYCRGTNPVPLEFSCKQMRLCDTIYIFNSDPVGSTCLSISFSLICQLAILGSLFREFSSSTCARVVIRACTDFSTNSRRIFHSENVNYRSDSIVRLHSISEKYSPFYPELWLRLL